MANFSSDLLEAKILALLNLQRNSDVKALVAFCKYSHHRFHHSLTVGSCNTTQLQSSCTPKRATPALKVKQMQFQFPTRKVRETDL